MEYWCNTNTVHNDYRKDVDKNEYKGFGMYSATYSSGVHICIYNDV